MLRYLKRKEIDAARWNRCIDNASTSLLYARTEYLDAMAHHWDAVVLGDYEAVMPLPFRIKAGFRYVHLPAFVQQLGIFSGNQAPEQLRLQFITLAEQRFRFGDYHFHYGHADPRLRSRNNFVLSLQPAYEEIRAQYKPYLQKRLPQLHFDYRNGPDPAAVIRLHRWFYESRQPSIKDADYRNFEKLCLQLQVVLRSAYEGTELRSAVLCLKDKNRLYLMMSVSTGEGRKKEANHFLIDRLIHEFSGSPLLLDFEGSEVPGIAFFYRKFGAVLQPYYFYRWNRLPWPLRILKKGEI